MGSDKAFEKSLKESGEKFSKDQQKRHACDGCIYYVNISGRNFCHFSPGSPVYMLMRRVPCKEFHC